MTEAEWLASDDAVAMLAGVEKLGSDRKFRLFAVAGCYLCKPRARKPKSKFECVVRFADGETGVQPVRKYWGRLRPGNTWPERPFVWARQFVLDTQEEDETGGMGNPSVEELVALLRCIFGNPFRPPHFAPEWRTDTAVTLAKQMYESCDFGAMPILADALQDAGCTNEELLAHCRAAAPACASNPGGVGGHVRGCWACDLVLGKA